MQKFTGTQKKQHKQKKDKHNCNNIHNPSTFVNGILNDGIFKGAPNTQHKNQDQDQNRAPRRRPPKIHRQIPPPPHWTHRRGDGDAPDDDGGEASEESPLPFR